MNNTNDNRPTSPTCQRCGACLEVCPVYLATGSETLSPRGKLAVIDQDAFPATQSLKACLLCGRCSRVCSVGTQPDETIRRRRSRQKDSDLPSAGFLFARNWSDPARQKSALQVWRQAQKFLADRGLPQESGLRVRLGSVLGGPDAVLPLVAERFLPELLAEAALPQPTTGPQVTFFAGCSLTYFETAAAMSAIKTLRQAGYRIRLAESFCCGLPALGLGDERTARRLARKNLDALLGDESEQIAFACTSCQAMMTHYYPLLLTGSQKQQAEALPEKVVDLYGLFEKSAPSLEPLKSDRPLLVYRHRPCHQDRLPGLSPDRLLARLPHVQLVDAPGGGDCCGGGGSFAITQRRLSVQIGQKKAASIVASRAEVVVTECPGCLIQIRSALAAVKDRPPVLHTLELADPNVVQKIRRYGSKSKLA